MDNKKYVITITRQFGSLGRPIAMEMAKRLKIQYYDRDIVDQAAKKLNLPVSVIDKSEESAQKKYVNPFSRMAFPLGMQNTTEQQNEIYEAQKNIISFLADKESCIIVGRCADYILQDMPNSMHIYIYAPYKVRLENCINELKINQKEAKGMINSVDKARAAYHENYAGYLPENPNHKDIMVDISFLGVEKTAEYLAELAKMKFDIN